jgi:RNA polymerase sigma factor (sigma-70 family)
MTTRTCSCAGRRRPLCDQCCLLTGLVPPIRNWLRRYARLYGWFLPDDELPDMTQDVLIGLVRSGRPTEQLRGLIPCVARRRLIDRKRQQAARITLEYPGARMDEEPSRAVLSGLALDIDQAMKLMSSDAQRIVFVARALDGLTRREAARVLGVSEGTVQHHYMRALAIVAEVLGMDAR